MIACFEQVDQEQYKDKPEANTASICNSEKEKVKSILRNNQMTMTRVVKERAMILTALSEDALGRVEEYDEPWRKYKCYNTSFSGWTWSTLSRLLLL